MDWWWNQTLFAHHPALPQPQKEAIKQGYKTQLLQGCFGVVNVMLGYATADWSKQLDKCYKDFNSAQERAERMTKKGECCNNPGKGGTSAYFEGGKGRVPEARIVWVQFSNVRNGRQEANIPVKDGVYDLSGNPVWEAIKSGVSPWNKPGTPPNFDFKIWMPDSKQWWGAVSGGANMQVTTDADLNKSLADGIAAGLETNLFCVVCEKDFKRRAQ